MNTQEKLAGGVLLGLLAGMIWSSQKNPPKVYLGNTRIHHYHAGTLLSIVGLLTKSPTAAGIGVGLLLDDIDDAQF